MQQNVQFAVQQPTKHVESIAILSITSFVLCFGLRQKATNFISDCHLSNFTCPAKFWKCANNRCIEDIYVCDGYKNGCGDGSDELECEMYPCLDSFVKCADFTQCVLVN